MDRTTCILSMLYTAPKLSSLSFIFYINDYGYARDFPGGLAVKNLPAMQEIQEMVGSIPGSGRSPEGGKGNPLQYSCQGDPIDRGAWWAKVHGVANNQIRLSD